jgi:hypothetical protein
MIPYGTSCQFHAATSCGFHTRLRRDDMQNFVLMIYNSCGFDDIHACGEFYAQVRDMSFGRDMRFAR